MPDPTNIGKPTPSKGVLDLRRLWNAALFSKDGFKAAFACEAAFRQELLLALVLLPAAFILHVSTAFKALLIASVFLVLIVEILNSAIEAIVDMTSPGFHLLAKRAKDLGSAAVLLSLMNLAAVWALALFW